MYQLDLFAPKQESLVLDYPSSFSDISGLVFIENFISDKEHNDLWIAINESIWLDDLKRRVQHYGYKYDYKKRSIDKSMYVGELPSWSKSIIDKLISEGICKHRPDQIIVNEYNPGQGIADHIDCEPCFEDTIISLSLGSTCMMEFKSKYNKLEKREKILTPKSLIVLTGEARYDWTHGIPSRLSDTFNDISKKRTKRISLTFRNVIL